LASQKINVKTKEGEENHKGDAPIGTYGDGRPRLQHGGNEWKGNKIAADGLQRESGVKGEQTRTRPGSHNGVPPPGEHRGDSVTGSMGFSSGRTREEGASDRVFRVWNLRGKGGRVSEKKTS